MSKTNEKYLVAVYGSLREGLHNHRVLKNADAKKQGSFISEPKFTLIDLGQYPGLYEGGVTSIIFEVYEVDDAGLISVNRLEGYTPGSNSNNFYDRITIDTPYGKAYTYIYQPKPDEPKVVIEGDWKSHVETKEKLNYEFKS